MTNDPSSTARRLAAALLGTDSADADHHDALATVLGAHADLMALAETDLDAAVARVTRDVVAQLHATARIAREITDLPPHE